MKNVDELAQITDKMSLINDREQLLKYVETVQDYLDIFALLDDNQKFEALNSEFFLKQGSTLKTKAVRLIQDENIKYRLLENGYIKNIIADPFYIKEILVELPEDRKLQLMQDGVSIKKLEIDSFSIRKIITDMSSDAIAQLMQNPETIQATGIADYEILMLLAKIGDDKTKEDAMSKYDLKRHEKIEVIRSFSGEYKREFLISNADLNRIEILGIIKSFNQEEMIDFMKNNEAFMREKDIRVFDVVRSMQKEQQLEFVKNMSQLNFGEKEMRMIIAGLSNETKRKLDSNLLEEKYRGLLDLKLDNGRKNIHSTNRIIPDLDGDLTKYKDLDELLYIKPLSLDADGRKKVLKLAEICPDMRVHDNIELGVSTAKEFIESEAWIDSVIERIAPDWTDIQKMAFIDVEIGKKISYSPDFETEIEDRGAERALWKIISCGYGVCNGIAQVEKYLLSRVGIESEMIGTCNHSFLKVNGIRIPTKDGVVKGDTLVDPTWNLANSRYGGKPEHFCNSYEEIRKADVDSNGKDHDCHKSEMLEHMALVNMDEQSLRKVYSSIGVADINGQFPIDEIIDGVERINQTPIGMRENIIKKMELIRKKCPEYGQCICSTEKVLSSIVFKQDANFTYNRCVVSRVYEKSDSNKSPVLYTYFDCQDEGEMFFFADKQSGEFVELSKESFEERFDCYDMDKEKRDGKMTWEFKSQEENLARSSGEIETAQKRGNEDMEI